MNAFGIFALQYILNLKVLSPILTIGMVLLFFGCKRPSPQLKSGQYTIHFHIDEIDIPVRLHVTDSTWNILNATEVISVKPHFLGADSFFVEMPLFHTYLAGHVTSDTTISGFWSDPTRPNNKSIALDISPRSAPIAEMPTSIEESIWECHFSPNDPENYSRAIGLFKNHNGHMHATFMTETGDYRFLEGNNTGQSMELSCFDGTHLFYFCANVHGDSLTDGHFLSGNTWEENWNGIRNPEAVLRHPDSLTTLKDGNPFRFQAMDTKQKTVEFDSTDFLNKVTIVQIFGSWCPNCTDESKFLKEMHGAYSNKGLQIIPVAFEREASIQDQLFRIQRQFNDLSLPYPPYLGGTSPKTTAEKVFPQLNHVISYPTAIIIDKKGKVRKIHTGFYGPGTGQHYQRHKEMLTLFVEKLLDES